MFSVQEIEMKSASLALEPLMLAERDREFLKQLRRNRWDTDSVVMMMIIRDSDKNVSACLDMMIVSGTPRRS